ncbi:hypothetical protein [Flavobacterium sp.]|uniref:hypothetical protein n=1 Tax=Flavobacterium sp. TaxID=239 RepID=UPI003BC9E622
MSVKLESSNLSSALSTSSGVVFASRRSLVTVLTFGDVATVVSVTLTAIVSVTLMVVLGDVVSTIVSSGITGNKSNVVSVVRGISIFGTDVNTGTGRVVSMGRITSVVVVVAVGTITTGSCTTGEGAMVTGEI